MAHDHGDFYGRVLSAEIARGTLALDARVLVVCGGEADCEVLARLGFTNVTVSNLGMPPEGERVGGFVWSTQNAEALTFEDEAFDFTLVHGGLHHCHSPHRALGEMLRVSRVGIALFEPKDGFFTRLGARLGFGQTYEDAAVFHNDFRAGGVVNGEIPNFVYRFTAHEIEKTVSSFLPEGRQTFRFYWATRIPWERIESLRNPAYRVLVRGAAPVLERLGRLPPFANNLAAVVIKARRPDDLHPWIRLDAEGRARVDADWLRRKYGAPPE